MWHSHFEAHDCTPSSSWCFWWPSDFPVLWPSPGTLPLEISMLGKVTVFVKTRLKMLEETQMLFVEVPDVLYKQFLLIPWCTPWKIRKQKARCFLARIDANIWHWLSCKALQSFRKPLKVLKLGRSKAFQAIMILHYKLKTILYLQSIVGILEWKQGMQKIPPYFGYLLLDPHPHPSGEGDRIRPKPPWPKVAWRDFQWSCVKSLSGQFDSLKHMNKWIM